MKSLTNKKSMAFIFTGLFLVAGIYNAVVINSQSSVSEGKFLKRLDEMNGNFQAGRHTASVVWKKLQPETKKVEVKVAPKIVQSQSVSNVEETKVSAIQEELKLNLVEVVNPNKYSKGLPNTQFSGSVNVSNGVIDSLTVSLPDSETLNVSFTELNGNVFNYDYAGANYSGMMYQVDGNTYMVSMTNGPLAGTRLRFAGELSEEQQQTENTLAENHNVHIGSFGNESEIHAAVEGVDSNLQTNIQAQSFNMESQQAVQ